MQNLLISGTGAVCAVFDTVANTADAVNGLSEAARLRSESFARITALQVELKEREAEFELDIATQQLDKIMNDPKAVEDLLRARNAAKAYQRQANKAEARSNKVQRPERKQHNTGEAFKQSQAEAQTA